MLDLKRLRYVTVLCKHRNFARAAEELRISQPALTRSIQAIEHELGVRLFERGRRGVEATSFGRLLVTHARNVGLAMDNLSRDLAVAKGEEPGKLSVGAGLWGGSSLVGAPLGRMAARFPAIRINLKFARWHELPDMLRQGVIDVMVGHVGEVADQEEFAVAPLSEHRGYIVCRRDHPLTGLAAPDATSVFGYPFAGPELPRDVLAMLGKLPKGTRDVWKRSGGLLPVRCDSSSVLKAIIARSDVISSMSMFMVANEVQRGELAVLRAPSLGLHGRYGAAWVVDRVLSTAARSFVDALLAHDQDLVEQEQRMQALQSETGTTSKVRRRGGEGRPRTNAGTGD